jgi:hypothetical protein
VVDVLRDASYPDQRYVRNANHLQSLTVTEWALWGRLLQFWSEELGAVRSVQRKCERCRPFRIGYEMASLEKARKLLWQRE